MAVSTIYRFNETATAEPTIPFGDLLQGANFLTAECLEGKERIEKLFEGENSDFTKFFTKVTEFNQNFQKKHIDEGWVVSSTIFKEGEKAGVVNDFKALKIELLPFVTTIAQSRFYKLSANAVGQKLETNLQTLQATDYDYLDTIQRSATNTMRDLVKNTQEARTSLQSAYSDLRTKYDETVEKVSAVAKILTTLHTQLELESGKYTLFGVPISCDQKKLLLEDEISNANAAPLFMLTTALLYKKNDAEIKARRGEALRVVFQLRKEALGLPSLSTLLEYITPLAEKEGSERLAEEQSASTEHTTLKLKIEAAIEEKLKEIDLRTTLKRAQSLSATEANDRHNALVREIVALTVIDKKRDDGKIPTGDTLRQNMESLAQKIANYLP